MAKKPNYRYTVEVARQYNCSAGVRTTTRFQVVITLDEFDLHKAEYAVEKLVEGNSYRVSNSYEHEYTVTKVEVL